MLAFFLWYLIITGIGLVTFPLAYRLLPALPDRGYAFSRMLGLLLWGYFFWLPGTLGILRNDSGGQVLALTALAALSYLALRGRNIGEIFSWLGKQRSYILAVEALFLLSFAAMAAVRAANPELNYTEKPMELAFINGILRSPGLPPLDSWLSGYAISYYYFGYILMAMLARFSGIAGSVAHNLGTALVFGLSAVGAYGVVYNLLRATAGIEIGEKEDQLPFAISHSPFPSRPVLFSFLGPLIVLLTSNLEGLLEILHSRWLFWKAGVGGELTSSFWSWLDILDLNQPPISPPSWLPRLFGTGQWWWWRASRVVRDFNFERVPQEIIDEFPFFAYLHADLHPHVLAMPFAFLAMSVALNLYLGGGSGQIRLPPVVSRLFGRTYEWALGKEGFLLAAVVLGGMFLLNAWDFPIYVALAAGAYALGSRKDDSAFLVDFLSLALALGIAGFLLYLPFYIGFSSQASGITPSLVYFTRGAHLWVMFGSLLLPLAAYLAWLWSDRGSWTDLRKGIAAALGAVLGLSLLSLLFVLLLALREGSLVPGGGAGMYGAPDWGSLLRESILRRLAAPGGWITLLVLLAGVGGLLLGNRRKDRLFSATDPQSSLIPLSPIPFSLLLILLGTLLVLGPEFFYLRDLFGSRMNTIFKFYFQAWLLWGIAVAYGSAVLLQSLRRAWKTAFAAGLVFVTAAALIYPVFGLIDKTNRFNPPGGWTLDGSAYMNIWAPDEQDAIRWLEAAPLGVIVEAVCSGGGSYRSECARFSTLTGLPGVMGWVWHEIQWRGSDELFRERPGDIELLYSTRDWSQAEQILRRYSIRYLVIGPRERETYSIYEVKFEQMLTLSFQQGNVKIYEVPQ